MRKIGLATPAALLLAGTLLVPLALPAPVRAGAADGAAGAAAASEQAQAWAKRLADAHAKLEAARAEVISAQAAVDRARNRHWPLGDPLAKLEQDLVDAKQKRDTLEADWPDLLEEARRSGVPAEVLRPYEN